MGMERWSRNSLRLIAIGCELGGPVESARATHEPRFARRSHRNGLAHRRGHGHGACGRLLPVLRCRRTPQAATTSRPPLRWCSARSPYSWPRSRVRNARPLAPHARGENRVSRAVHARRAHDRAWNRLWVGCAVRVSLALGAFFAGVVLSESDLSQRAAADSLPLKDAFAVLFFVSVGMLFDPSILVEQPLAVLAVLGVILLGKSLVAFAIVIAFGHPVSTALTVSASLAQIGEFSFILSGLATDLGILPLDGRDLILAGAILSIALNPLAFLAVPAVATRLRRLAWPRWPNPVPNGGASGRAQAR